MLFLFLVRSLFHCLSQKGARSEERQEFFRRTPRSSATRRWRFCPGVEGLELRTVPSTLIVASAADDGTAGTLRALIGSASPGDTIKFGHQLDGQTITLALGQLVIGKSLTIAGPGAGKLAVSGNVMSRVFDITGGVNVTITDLAIIRGLADQGGGIHNEPGATLTVSQCSFTGNQAVGGSSGTGYGGGILNEGTATVVANTFTSNFSTGGGAGYGSGGGISNFGPDISISRSTFVGNQANDGLGQFAVGGAVDNEAGTMAVEHDVFIGNQAVNTSTESFGGALDNFFATISVSNCTFTGNLSSGASFAESGAFDNVGMATVSNSTFANNRALTNHGEAQGGAITNNASFGPGDFSLSVANCSFSGDEAFSGSGSFPVVFGAPSRISSRNSPSRTAPSRTTWQSSEDCPAERHLAAASTAFSNSARLRRSP